MLTRFAPLPAWFAPAFAAPAAAVSRGPRVSARTTETGLELRVELPGVAEQDIELSVEGRVLTIAASRAEGDQRWSATRKLSIGTGYDLDAIAAHYANGLLTVTVPVVRPVSRTVTITPAPQPVAVEATTAPAAASPDQTAPQV